MNSVEEFLEKQGPGFHIRLMMLHENMVADQHKPENDDVILHFEFPEGEYSIRYGLLKERADKETVELLYDYGLELKKGKIDFKEIDGPVGVGGRAIKLKTQKQKYLA